MQIIHRDDSFTPNCIEITYLLKIRLIAARIKIADFSPITISRYDLIYYLLK